MSVDYYFFLRSPESCEELGRLMASVDGVRHYRGTIKIKGLAATQCTRMSDRSRMIMLEDFGDWGMDFNWCIRGTHDREIDIFELMERLYRCAAAIINHHPDLPLALMREAESIYIHNSAERLTIWPAYLEDIPVKKIFSRSVFVDEMAY